MSPVLVTVLLVVANVMGVGMIVPQVLRIRRVRSADGVSGVWIGVGIAMNSWWTAYGLAESLPGILPVSVLAALLYVVMARQYVGLVGRAGWRPLLVGAAVVGVAPLPALAFGGFAAAGLVVGSTYAVQFSPAVVSAMRSRDPRGVSAMTWAMALVEASIWVVYGIVSRDAALIIGGSGGSVASSAILARLAWVRRGRHRGLSPEPSPIRLRDRTRGNGQGVRAVQRRDDPAALDHAGERREVR